MLCRDDTRERLDAQDHPGQGRLVTVGGGVWVPERWEGYGVLPCPALPPTDSLLCATMRSTRTDLQPLGGTKVEDQQ